MNDSPALSHDKKRNKAYTHFLALCDKGQCSLDDLIHLGAKLMTKAKLHPHFFLDNTLMTTAKHLAYFALQFHPNEIYRLHTQLNIQDAKKVITLFERRINEKIPVEYITHEAIYLGRPFYVNENVLVPRSIMNTRFEDFLNETTWENYRVLDLCTGSGCIGITLALLKPEIRVDLVDISAQALDVAQINIDKYALSNRVQCIESNLFENVPFQYDLIITNPPYVTVKEYQASAEEFKKEPKIALESGVDGLDIIHRILKESKQHLTAQGKLIAEVGYTAAKRIKKHYRKIPFKWYKYRRPNGKESWLGMHGIFECSARDLP